MTQSAASGKTVTVDYATADGTATSPADYTATSGTLTFNPGQTTKTVNVTVNGDTINELDEIYTVGLSNLVNVAPGILIGTGTIIDDDAPPTVSINNASVIEGNIGTTNVSFDVTLSAASGKTVTVDYGTADGTAVAPTDYAATSGTLTFTPGQTTKTLNVTVNGDTTLENDETFGVALSNLVNVTAGTTIATGTIVNDDAQPSLSVDDPVIDEGNAGSATMTFTLSLSNPSAFPVSVDVATADNTANAPSDYTPTTTTLTFNPGQTTASVDVSVIGDTVFEGNELLELHLSNPVGATIADAVGVGTIRNDDGAPTLSINDVSIPEGNAGTTNMTFTVSLTGVTALPVTVDVATVDGTAISPGDYDANAAMLTFFPGETTHTFDVIVHGDTTFENDENFSVQLTNAAGATILDPTGVGTVVNDEAAPSLSIDDVSAPEGNAGTTPATFTVTLSGASASPVSVDVTTQDGTAFAPGDYDAISATITFAPGETKHTFDVLVQGDAVVEANETFTVVLSNAVGAPVLVGTGTGTILDDELPVFAPTAPAASREPDPARRRRPRRRGESGDGDRHVPYHAFVTVIGARHIRVRDPRRVGDRADRLQGPSSEA